MSSGVYSPVIKTWAQIRKSVISKLKGHSNDSIVQNQYITKSIAHILTGNFGTPDSPIACNSLWAPMAYCQSQLQGFE